MRHVEQVEGVSHVQLVTSGGVLGHAFQRVVVADFAHRRGAGVLIHQGAQVLQEARVLRAAEVVDVALPV